MKTLQVQYKQQLALISLGFSFQNLSQSPSTLPPLRASEFPGTPLFCCLKNSLNALHDQEYIYTLAMLLVPKPIQLS